MENNEQQAIQKGDLVWFNSSAGHPEPARVLNIEGTKAFVQPTSQKEAVEVPLTEISKRSSEAMAFEDLVQLEDISNAAISWALKTRFDFDKCYTYIGNVLVSVNRYRPEEGNLRNQHALYTEKTAKSLPAHLFGFAANVFNQMLTSGICQSIFPTGSIGSGKSELCKRLIRYLTRGSLGRGPTTSELESAMTILESFTNAKTNANDSSTRCAKVFSLCYEKRCLRSANVSLLLLEKFRLVAQAKQERNFHVFYQLLAGLDAQAKQSFGLTDPKNYFYLNQGKGVSLASKTDASDYRLLEEALEAVKIKSDQKHCILRLLAAILHLGNVYFEEEEDESGTKTISIGNSGEVQWCAYLLQMDADALVRKLTTKESQEQKTVQRLSLERALDMRDALAKELYATLVSWLVSHINKRLEGPSGKTSITIVDMFGFECYKTNTFEQLCVNYVNEKVQQFFVRVSFCTEQLEYNEEEIAWGQSVGQCLANDAVINLLTKKPNGILQLLADECNFPKGSDESFVVKCDSCHQDNDAYIKKKTNAHEFTIQHFFGPLRYNALGYVERNRQFANGQVLSILQESQNTLVRQMLSQVKTNSTSLETELEEKMLAGSSKVHATVTASLQNDAKQLICRLDKSFTHFVRCLNPNKCKVADKFELPFVHQQVRALGLLEILKMQKFGFPHRLTYAEFINKYGFLQSCESANDKSEQRNQCLKILAAVMKEHSQEFRLGKTKASIVLYVKVFMKETILEHLDKTVEKRLGSAITAVQRVCRGFLVRRRYKQCKKAIIVIQSRVRGYNARMRFARMKLLAREKAMQSAKQSKILSAFRAMTDASHCNEESRRLDSMVAVVDHIPLPKVLSDIIYHCSGTIPEEYVVRDDLGMPFRDQELIVPHDLYYYPFEKFVSLCFKYHNWKSRRDPISTPFLHKDNEEDIEQSLMLFKLILRYMNDSSLTEDQEILLANYIIKQGIDKVALRDEIYAQIINQVHENPNQVNADRGWRLMTLCSSSFPPSTAMFKYILNFIMNTECDGFQNLIKNKLLRSVHDENTTCRSHPPTVLEHRAIKCKGKMILSSYLSDGTKLKSQVESWTKAEDFASLSLQQWGFDEHNGWTVSIENDATIFHLSGNHYLLDFISYLEQPKELQSKQADCITSMKHDGMSDLYGITASERLDALQERRRPSSSPSSKPPTGRRLYMRNHDRTAGNEQGRYVARPPFTRESNESLCRSTSEAPIINDQEVDDFLNSLIQSNSANFHSAKQLAANIRGRDETAQAERSATLLHNDPLRHNQHPPPLLSMPSYAPPVFVMLPCTAGKMLISDWQQLSSNNVQAMPTLYSSATADKCQMAFHGPSEANFMLPLHGAPLQCAPYTVMLPNMDCNSSHQIVENLEAIRWLLGANLSFSSPYKTFQPSLPAGAEPFCIYENSNSGLAVARANGQSRQNGWGIPAMPSQNGHCPTGQLPYRPMPPGQSSIDTFGNWHVSSCFHLSNSFFNAIGSGNKLVYSVSRQPEQMDSQKSLLSAESLNTNRSLSNGNSDLERCTIVSENGSAEPEVDENMSRRLVSRYMRAHQGSNCNSEVSSSFDVGVANNRSGSWWSTDFENRSMLSSGEKTNEHKVISNRAWKHPAVSSVRKDGDTDVYYKGSDLCASANNLSIADRESVVSDSSTLVSCTAKQGDRSVSGVSNRLSTVPQSNLDLNGRYYSKRDGSVADHFGATLSGLREKRKSAVMTYGRVPWRVYLRKELFFPSETLQHTASINAIFHQIVRDCFNEQNNFRLEKKQRIQMLRLLNSNGIHEDCMPLPDLSISFKKHVIQIARSWPLYFCRLYPVMVQRKAESNIPRYLAISESGVWIIAKERDISKEGGSSIIECFEYDDVDHTEASKNEFSLSTINGVVVRMITESAEQIENLVNNFLYGPHQGKKLVRATSDYITAEPNLLSFRKGQVIQLVKTISGVHPGEGWLYGKIDSNYGFFPKEHLQTVEEKDENDVEPADTYDAQSQRSEYGPMQAALGPREKLTMMEFAMQHFKKSPRADSGQSGTFSSTLKRKPKKEWTWKEVADQIKHTKNPIDSSLLKLEKASLNKLAVECFLNLMMYMGDYPLKKDANYMDCVYKILAACRDHPTLRDEVYCQVIKQLTNNKSSKPDSALMGWRMLSILTSYFDSSDVLRPYLLKHLKEAASDSRRPYHGTASECYQNFKQTLQFGGRKCLLSPKELDSISQGKNLKRQVYHLPGGTKKVINTKAVTVVEEVIRQLCQDLNIKSSLEQQEFSLCVVIETSNTMRILSNDEYILDVTTELENNGLDYFILLKRIVWMHPLRKDSELYTDIMFFQVLPDYLEGLLVIMRGPDSLSAATMDDIASLGALLVCADEGWDGQFIGAQDVGTFLPKTVFQVRHVSMELWADRVNQKLRMLSSSTSRNAARAAFLDLLQTWPLFGSIFFYIPGLSDPRVKGECLLALNRYGAQFLDIVSHELFFEIRPSQILSIQKSGSGDYLEITYRHGLQQHVLNLQTNQGGEISHLFDQYIYVDSQSRGLLSKEMRR
ncbi:hypothetical protein M513_03711 [Trichuris suis]|uniref:Unconventional myosin-XV n=1 Tax=Trichuris suis TaxID=68888 RepID=A0A085MDS5_9BILA|nr:hypothetical protein M513_03711 [Trichuris suis]